MKSNVCVIGSDVVFDQNILREVDKTAVYNGLDKKSALRLRLLAEEFIRMLPNLSCMYKGEFWVETEGNAYALHAKYETEGRTRAGDEALLSVSSTGKNAMAAGVVGKIRAFIDRMTLPEGGAFARDHAIFSAGMMDSGTAKSSIFVRSSGLRA